VRLLVTAAVEYLQGTPEAAAEGSWDISAKLAWKLAWTSGGTESLTPAVCSMGYS